MPNVSLCQLSLVDTNFVEDVENAKTLGVGGLGVTESKLRDGDPAVHQRLFEKSGLQATICAPDVLTVLPQPPGSRFGGPSDLDARGEAMIEGLRNLAPLHPDTVFFATGPAGGHSPDRARAAVVDAFQGLSEAAAQVGTRIAVEPMRDSARADWTIVSSLQETLGLLDDVGRDNVGIVFDTWHMWDSPHVSSMLRPATERIFGVQIADYRQPTRGPRDRVVAGDGVADIARLLWDLRAAGYDGWYDMEVFSDDGRFGAAYPDSLWKLEPIEFARRQVDGFVRCWNSRP